METHKLSPCATESYLWHFRLAPRIALHRRLSPLARFDQLERRVDYAEGRAEAMSLADKGQPTLADEIAALADGDKIEAELAEMKAAMGSGGNAGQGKSE